MVDTEVPSDVQALLRDHIESHEQLEALLLLRNHSHGLLDAQRVASELGVSEGIAEEALRRLCGHQLLGIVVGPRAVLFRYDPESPELDRTIERLDAAHLHQRLEIMKLMTANAIERLRASALITFGDGSVQNDAEVRIAEHGPLPTGSATTAELRCGACGGARLSWASRDNWS